MPWLLATNSGASSKSLEQACSAYGRSVAATRSKDAQKYSRAGDAILAKTTDPDARAAAAAEDTWVKTLAAAPADSPLFHRGDPITAYCRSHYAAAYYKGGG